MLSPDFVVAIAAKQGVGAHAAVQRVAARAALQRVVAFAPGQRVGSFAAIERIGTRQANDRIGAVATHQQIVAFAAVDGVVAALTVNGVVPGSTADGIRRVRGDKEVIAAKPVDSDHARQCHRHRCADAEVEHVVDAGAGDPLIVPHDNLDLHTETAEVVQDEWRGRVVQQSVRAVSARHRVAKRLHDLDVQVIVVVATPHGVGALAADQGVIAFGAFQRVVASAAIERVGPVESEHRVVAITAVQVVAAAIPVDLVVASLAKEQIAAGSATDDIVTGAANHILGTHQRHTLRAGTVQPEVENVGAIRSRDRSAVHGDRLNVGQESEKPVERNVGGSALTGDVDQGVGAIAAVEHIGLGGSADDANLIVA